MPIDIVVVGAGLAGLAAAIHLHRHGLDVVVCGPWHGRAAFAGAADLFGHRLVAVAALAALALRVGLGPVALARKYPRALLPRVCRLRRSSWPATSPMQRSVRPPRRAQSRVPGFVYSEVK